MTDNVYIGPIQHSNDQCQKNGCDCWCQACERHNWRHERDEWRNHIPSGYEDLVGYGQVSCSCGWDSSDVLGWEQHINAEASRA